MALTPTTYDTVSDFTQIATTAQPSRTYKVRFDNSPSSGMLDGLEAVKQSIFCILTTERFIYEMFSFNYGVEIQNKIGRVPSSWILGDLKDTITDALLQDDRILSVYDFQYAIDSGIIYLAFRVETTEGEVECGLTWSGEGTEVEIV